MKTMFAKTMLAIAAVILFGASLAHSQGTVPIGTRPLTVNISNETGTGTTLYKLAKLTGAPSKAILASTSDTSDIVGIAVFNAGTSGTVQVAVQGIADCTFGTGTTAGNYVGISSAVAGNCADIGGTYPTSGQVLGRVLSTNGGSGVYRVMLHLPEEVTAPGGSSGQHDLTTVYWSDDFLGGSDTRGSGVADFSRNGSIGQLGWTQIREDLTNAYTELGVADTDAETAQHPGILYLTATDDSADSMVRISAPIGNNAGGPMHSTLSIAETFHFRCVVNAYQIQSGVGGANTSLNQVFGLAASNITSADASGVSFAYLRSADPPQTTWHMITGSPFVDFTDTGVTVDTSFHLFEILHTGGTTTYTFKIDGATEGALTFDFEAEMGTSLMIPFLSLIEDSQGTSEKYMAVDFCDLLITGLERY